MLFLINNIIQNFIQFINAEWKPDDPQIKSLNKLVLYAKSKKQTIVKDYKVSFIESVNNKLDLNSTAYQNVLDYAFQIGVKFNYIQKRLIKEMLDACDKERFSQFLVDNGIEDTFFCSHFNPVNEEITFEELQNVISNDKKFNDIISSIFSRYCFNLFDWKTSHECFSGSTVKEDYFEFLSDKYPDLCIRNHAMAFIDVPKSFFINDYFEGCNKILNTIKRVYTTLNNHCEMLIYIPKLMNDDGTQWKLYSDIILYSEKLAKEKIDRAYFRWKKIGNITKDYIQSLVPYNAEFDVAFEGFVFKDCFIIGEENNYSMLLVFEKNIRDERPVNCPACYSESIQGNSYPILNVKSWECENPLCPDRSKYNRGKRYSFMAQFRQKQLQDEENLIPEQSISKWHLDCVKGCSKVDVFEMSIMHYSCVGDEIDVYTENNDLREDLLNRKIHRQMFPISQIDIINRFKESSYFYRYIQNDNRSIGNNSKCDIDKSIIYHGDAYDVLRELSNNSIDGVVTSPPYYNAKTYSQWGNIYCYLYDMYNISKEIYRVMKDGAIFLFNIFDYFDNENNVSLSAMGNKRMILGAYMIDIFQRIGLTIVGNIIWNKGEIQGHRSFNQGNLTPYYQAPLNCWEHILILSKGQPNNKYSDLVSQIKDLRPVVKMVHGKNILGHDAPFPTDIPEMIIKKMSENDVILDPFLGSGTTAIVANMYNVKSIGIEKNDAYYELCKSRISQSTRM